MLPITQQKKDDCFQAAIASILELDLKDIPAYNEEETKFWYDDAGKSIIVPGDRGFDKYLERLNIEYLSLINLNILYVTFPDNTYFVPGFAIGNVIVSSEDEFKGLYHAVIMHDGKIIFDPSTKRDTRKYENTGSYFIFYCLDPSKGKGI